MFRAPPVGTVDRLYDAAKQLRQVESTVIQALVSAGYHEVVVPLIEREEVFSSSEGAVRFVDRHGEVLGLRADFTGPVARVVATRLKAEPLVRLCYTGVVFRDLDARSMGRRQLHQAGYELFDDGGVAGDVEAIRQALRICDALGIEGVRVSIGSAAVIHALCPDAGSDVRRALDRRDRSGLPASLLPLLEHSGEPDVLRRAFDGLPAAAHPALERLRAVLDGLGADAQRAVVDLAEVRPWAYYTGVVFNVFGRGMRGSIAGGGRYDTLTARYGAARPAIGASVDVDEIVQGAGDLQNTRKEGLTVALPKGRIRSGVLERLGDLGPLRSNLESRKLTLPGQRPLGGHPVSFLLVKDADIAAYVERGAADLGIVGRDVLEETPSNTLQPLVLDLGRCRMSLCGPPGTRPHELAAKGTLRVATKYPRIAARALEERALPAEIIQLQGSVELSVVAGMADVIVDMVETGSTLTANGLVELEQLMESTARVIVNRSAWRLKGPQVRELLNHLGGV